MHIVYLLEVFTDSVCTKYIGSKSNAQIIDEDVISDGQKYMTSTTSEELKTLLSSGVKYKFSLLGEFSSYEETLRFERELHIKYDVVASPEYFNKSIATVNNYTDPSFATYKHTVTGKIVRLKRDHPMVLSGEYVGVQKGVKLSEEEKKKRGRSGEKNGFYGKTHTEENKRKTGERTSIHMKNYYSSMTEMEYNELCEKRSKAATGLKKPKEWRDRMQGAAVLKNPTTGELKRVYSHEKEEYIKNGWVGQNAGIKQKTIVCPHCGKEGSVVNMKRWHFDSCKHKHDSQ